jgi:CHAT domain-containing protein/Tfp pilus assembly protein PilF
LWVLLGSLSVYPFSRQQPHQPVALSPGAELDHELTGGETHVYRISLQPGQFARLVADQRNLDLVLILFDPDGQEITRVNNYAGYEPEQVSLVAEKAGDYQLKINAARPNAAKARYGIRLVELRPMEPQDLRAIAADRKVSQACLVWRQGGSDSRQQAGNLFRAALSAYRKLGDRRGEAEALTFLGAISVQSTRYREAIDYHAQAVPLWRELANRRLEAFSLNDIGYAHQNLGEFRLALDYYNQALTIRESLPIARELAQTLTSIGVVCTEIGEAEQALASYRRSLALARESGDKVQQAYALNSLALLQVGMGESQEALIGLREALSLWKEVGYRNGEADALNTIGLTYDRLGDAQAALDYFSQALVIWEATGNRTGAAQTLNNVGVACYYQRDFQQALAYYERALALWRAIGNRREEASTLNNIGLVRLEVNDPVKAMSSFEQALDLNSGDSNIGSRSSIFHNIGLAHCQSDEFDKALDYFQQSLDLGRQLRDRDAEAKALRGMALAHLGLNRLEPARTEIEAALGIIESLRARTASLELRALVQSRHMSMYRLHTHVLMALHRADPTKGYDSLAFTATEYGRARSLLDSLSLVREETRQRIDPRLISSEKALRLKIEAKERERLRLPAAEQKDKVAAIDREINDLLLQKEQLEARIRAYNPQYASLMNAPRPGVADIQLELDADTLLLEYFISELPKSSSYLWLVSRDSLSSFRLPAAKEIEDEARRVYDSLAERNRQIPGESLTSKRARLEDADVAYAAASARLSGMLLGPVAAQLDKKRLIIVAEGMLQYIPFAALPTPRTSRPGVTERQKQENGRPISASRAPLIADHEIVSLASGSVLVQLRQRLAHHAPAPKTLAVFADPVFHSDDGRVREIAEARNRARAGAKDNSAIAAALARSSDVRRSARAAGVSDFVRLRFSRREAEAISSFAPEAMRRTALDFAASREAALAEPLDQYRILHFATHGLLNSTTPALSGLVLSLVDEGGQPRNGFLRLHEIYNLKLNADLVVLSACQTALGKKVQGEGLIGLTRGFQYAGAPRVVASLWRVDDQATAELMKRFYQGMLRGGLRPAAALRAAQISLARETRWKNPYYWAAFTLQGEWR